MASTKSTLSKKDLKRIESCKTAAKHHQEAAKCHIQAIKHYQAGDFQNAFKTTAKAYKHSWYARKYEMEETVRKALQEAHNDLISHVII